MLTDSFRNVPVIRRSCPRGYDKVTLAGVLLFVAGAFLLQVANAKPPAIPTSNPAMEAHRYFLVQSLARSMPAEMLASDGSKIGVVFKDGEVVRAEGKGKDGVMRRVEMYDRPLVSSVTFFENDQAFLKISLFYQRDKKRPQAVLHILNPSTKRELLYAVDLMNLVASAAHDGSMTWAEHMREVEKLTTQRPVTITCTEPLPNGKLRVHEVQGVINIYNGTIRLGVGDLTKTELVRGVAADEVFANERQRAAFFSPLMRQQQEAYAEGAAVLARSFGARAPAMEGHVYALTLKGVLKGAAGGCAAGGVGAVFSAGTTILAGCGIGALAGLAKTLVEGLIDSVEIEVGPMSGGGPEGEGGSVGALDGGVSGGVGPSEDAKKEVEKTDGSDKKPKQ